MPVCLNLQSNLNYKIILIKISESALLYNMHLIKEKSLKNIRLLYFKDPKQVYTPPPYVK